MRWTLVPELDPLPAPARILEREFGGTPLRGTIRSYRLGIHATCRHVTQPAGAAAAFAGGGNSADDVGGASEERPCDELSAPKLDPPAGTSGSGPAGSGSRTRACRGWSTPASLAGLPPCAAAAQPSPLRTKGLKGFADIVREARHSTRTASLCGS